MHDDWQTSGIGSRMLRVLESAARAAGLTRLTGDVLDATTCLYTVTPDHDFIIDRMPGNDRVVIGAGFSGHGFKFTPAIGRVLKDIVDGGVAPERFRADR